MDIVKDGVANRQFQEAADGTLDIVDDLGKSGEVLGRITKGMGVVGAVYDAGKSFVDMTKTFSNKNSTFGERAGATAKFVFKATMIAAKVNPVIGLTLGILDITGATDVLFKW